MRLKRKDRNVFETLFLHPKPVKMLTSLRNAEVQYATQVSKAVDCTYSHTVKVLEMFRILGLVSFEKKGRIKIVKLTDNGLDVAHDFEGIRRKFKKLERNVRDKPSKK